ncbi:MAG: DUF418 domain-containing protein [Actinomycetia bacterium]|nr:DUF418 domain-containing protein [Actinomycetes bacterium]
METPAESQMGPTPRSARITSLDTIRGFAVLGILTMNVVSYGLGTSSYFNIDASSPQTWLDWFIGGFGEIFFDQKFMGLFSMLFGAGIVLFADRASVKGLRAGRLSLWRNFLLLLIGLAHASLWDGDVLVVYAVCAPLLVVLRNLSARVLFIAGALAMLVSPVGAAWVQTTIDATGEGLGEYWGDTGTMSDAVGLWLITDFFFRALGMMLIGVGAYRTGFLKGNAGDDCYRRSARWGLGLGLPLSAAGFAFVAVNNFEPDVAVIGSIPNTVATVPVVFGYTSLITLWHRRTLERPFNERVRAVGRMALTNYLSQTVLGILILRGLFNPADLNRMLLVLFMVGVWALQLWWSRAWLARHRYGPAEWVWRVATYRRLPG